MLSVRGPQHSFSTRTDDLVKVSKFFRQKMTWGGLEPPILGFMPNGLTIWAISARYLRSYVLEYWLSQYMYIQVFVQVELAIQMLTVREQQRSFSTHDRILLWKLF